MDGDAGAGALLPHELLEAQLGQIDLLMAMYPGDESIIMSETSTCAVESLREWLAEDAPSQTCPAPPTIDLLLQLDVTETSLDNNDPRHIQLHISVPLHHAGVIAPTDPPAARVRLQQASWMSKAERSTLAAHIADDDDLFAAIENITDAVSTHLSRERDQVTAASSQTHSPDTSILTRVWFYFPSISTRAKRDDLINHAPSYGLTGFLLAGKPGILCLEGDSQAVDDYMKFIKTESWGDIPAHHKKVSERYRQVDIKCRVFVAMQEITDQLERRGERANRNDMRALESWLGERGLQDAFAKVLI